MSPISALATNILALTSSTVSSFVQQPCSAFFTPPPRQGPQRWLDGRTVATDEPTEAATTDYA